MSPVNEADALLIQRVRQGEEGAWSALIEQYEGRLLAFAESRVGDRTAAEDIVQESFIGFLTSLPNYDESRPLEGWLFSIVSHKLTDHLRRKGRRPAVSLSSAAGSESKEIDLPGGARRASTIARSGERRRIEQEALAAALEDQVRHWRGKGDWQKIKCMELLFVAGEANKDVAERLDLTEQQVANFKHDFLARLRKTLRSAGLDAEVFPELYAST